MKKEIKVYIDASADIQYASYYIYGLYELFGKHNVKFSSRYFKKFKHDNHFFAFIIIYGAKNRKVIIDFTDDSNIDKNALEWCDVYGKVNLEFETVKSEKIVAIGPSFGIQIYSLFETIWFSSINLLKAFNRISNKRKFLSDYKAQYKRPEFSDYKLKQSKNNYVFFMASLWKKEHVTNLFRANFIKCCKSFKGIHFEGGFAPRTKNDIKGYEDITNTSRVEMGEYLGKIKDSLLVFNTPAVANCHGWKLAEYLSLGKAIISTPLSRQMPNPTELNKTLVYTTGDIEDIRLKVDLLFSNPYLRMNKEESALSYYNEYLAPQKVLELLVNYNENINKDIH